MARSSRLSVCFAIVMRNSSKIHCARSISRQRNTMDRRHRAPLDHIGGGLTLEVIELGWLTWRLAVHESVRPASVEAQYPIPDDLKPHAADLGRLGARRTVIDRRKRQKPSGLRAIFASPGQTPQLRRIKILA